ncbi:MAG: cytochrome c maturation protein CcmE [Spirochaetes bacterium]|nr:cytochrome c maturation protein CcmE [Spirochaetota bacterium]
MKNKKIIIFIIIIALLVIAILSISDNIFSPYVTFRYAKENPAKYVQIIGKRTKGSKITHDSAGFSFTLTDEKGEELEIFHSGVKPQNFEHAEQIVILGKYSLEKKLLEADKVLTKCPSKYQKGKEQND